MSTKKVVKNTESKPIKYALPYPRHSNIIPKFTCDVFSSPTGPKFKIFRDPLGYDTSFDRVTSDCLAIDSSAQLVVLENLIAQVLCDYEEEGDRGGTD